MKINLSTSINGVGAAGEEVDIDAKLAKKLADDGHGELVGGGAPKDEKSQKADESSKTEMVEKNDPKATS